MKKLIRKLFHKEKEPIESKSNLPTIGQIEEIKINQGKILTELYRNKNSNNIQDYEFQVFSQWGEDGIIQHLINSIEIKNKTFIEFGVEDFMESNCRFLLMNNNWSGFVLDGSAQHINFLKNSYFYWQYNLVAENHFVTRDNINEILSHSNFENDLGILSIDLDGNDYYVLENIEFFKPRIIIVEYNSVFGNERCISTPYDESFDRTEAHHSNLFWGASLGSLHQSCISKDYSLVGTNNAGNNAFFVRNDLMNEKLQSLSVKDAFTLSQYREDRNENGILIYTNPAKRLDIIRGLPVFNTDTGTVENL